MKRRYFLGSGLAAGAAVTSVSCNKAESPASAAPKKALMYPGSQFNLQTDDGMNFLVRHGIKNKIGYPDITGQSFTLESLEKL
ncbi:MAG: mannonate dehydratase, partial [Candidatus Latescibacterota bacterium]